MPVDPQFLAEVLSNYESANQSHVFAFYNLLPPAEQSSFLDQLASIDVHRVNRIYTNATASPAPGEQAEWEPLKDEDCASIINNPTEEAQWREAGLKAIADNSVAVLLLAGGQGTRLGSSLPKGMYDIGLPSKSSLFSLQAGRIKRLERLAEESSGKQKGEVRIRWYVMTSGPTRPDTEKYFKEMGYFGLKPENVIFFEQGALRSSIGLTRLT